MLLHFVFYASVVIMTSLATPVLYSRTTTSSCPRVSGCYCKDLSAHCRGNDTVYVQAVQALPSNLETFVFSMETTEKHMSLDPQMGGGLGRFWNLQYLQIQPYSREFEYDYDIQNAMTPSVFCNLTNLRELHLNAFMKELKPDAVQCLKALDTLDLSYTRALRTDDLKAVLAAPLSQHITKLLLRNVQRFNDAEANIQEVDFTILFRGLNRKNLRILDLAQNALTSLKPGLLLMPRLERLDLSNNLFLVQHVWSRLSTFTLLEAINHPGLQALIAVDQGVYPTKKQSTVWTKRSDTRFHERDEKRPSDETTVSTNRSWETLVMPVVSQVSASNKTKPELAPFPAAQDTKCVLYIPIGKHLSIINFRGALKEAGPYKNPVYHGTICLSPDNNLQEVDISNMLLALFFDDPTFANVTISGLTKLRVFKARNNGLTTHYRTFLNIALPSLRTVLLGGNQLTIGPNHPQPSSKQQPPLPLEHLDLSRNGLSVIPRQEFVQFSNLHILDLSGNQLEEFDLQLPVSLQLLNISGNKLTFLRENVTRYLDTFHNLTVDVTSNSFVCGCKVYYFIRWIQHAKIDLTNQHDLYCFTQRGRMRMSEINLRTLRKECNPMTPMEVGTIGASASIALCLAVLLCFITYRRRWRIRHYFYRRRLRREWAQLNDDYEYDAFIAYSDETPEVRRWVNVTMQTELEQNRGLRLFLHQRDLLGGGLLLERIDDAMRRCRKTVLVLSPEFLRSRICLYQAWSAHTSMVTEQRDAVVLVKQQALPLAGITGTLTSLMEIRECLNWTDDPEGQELFWKRLRDVLLSPPDTPIND